MYQVTGNLTIHGVTKQFTIPPANARRRPRSVRRSAIRFPVPGRAQAERLRHERTAWTKHLVGDAVGITVSFEGTLDQPAGAAPARPDRSTSVPIPRRGCQDGMAGVEPKASRQCRWDSNRSTSVGLNASSRHGRRHAHNHIAPRRPAAVCGVGGNRARARGSCAFRRRPFGRGESRPGSSSAWLP